MRFKLDMSSMQVHSVIAIMQYRIIIVGNMKDFIQGPMWQ
jgi:hypothetical protein